MTEPNDRPRPRNITNNNGPVPVDDLKKYGKYFLDNSDAQVNFSAMSIQTIEQMAWPDGRTI